MLDLKPDRELTEDELLALADRLDELDLGEVWDQLTPVEVERRPRRVEDCVVLPPSLMDRVRARARKLGKTPEAFIKECVRAGLAAR
jgi:hypothetical protein